MEVNRMDKINSHEYNEKYINGNIREKPIKGERVSNQVLKLIGTQDNWVDSKFISNQLNKTPEQINMVLRSLRNGNKVEFKWVKSQRSNRTLLIYKSKEEPKKI